MCFASIFAIKTCYRLHFKLNKCVFDWLSGTAVGIFGLDLWEFSIPERKPEQEIHFSSNRFHASYIIFRRKRSRWLLIKSCHFGHVLA